RQLYAIGGTRRIGARAEVAMRFQKRIPAALDVAGFKAVRQFHADQRCGKADRSWFSALWVCAPAGARAVPPATRCRIPARPTPARRSAEPRAIPPPCA